MRGILLPNRHGADHQTHKDRRNDDEDCTQEQVNLAFRRETPSDAHSRSYGEESRRQHQHRDRHDAQYKWPNESRSSLFES